MESSTHKILTKIITRWPTKAVQTGGKPLPPETKQEKLCATGKCRHQSCLIVLEVMKLELIDSRDFLVKKVC